MISTTAPIDVERLNEFLTPLDARERLAWGAENFGPRMALLSSMQKTSSVLIHLFHSLGLEQEVLFVDTGFHFHETLRLRDEMIQKYRVNLRTLYPELTPQQQEAAHGRKLHLFIDGQPECCRMRKEEPFLQYARRHGKTLIVNGLRQSEGGRRKKVEPIMADPRVSGHVLHPLSDWSEEDVEAYLSKHDVPVNPLHAHKYPSIGCECCTTPVAAGEDPRAGRWRHLRVEEGQPMYCGINFTDGSGI